jgi:uncharacterized membrane protein YphA (DoxX/SURF4 family)
MNISQAAAMNIVPVLARIVLAAAFIPAGWGKVFGKNVPFTGDDAQVLIELGISSSDPAAEAIQKVSLQSDDAVKQEGAEQAGGTPDRAAPDVAPPPPADPSNLVSPPATPATTVMARPLHHITIMLHNANWPWEPALMAWVAALTELLGGALIFIGLFSRIWGLGLATAMGFAFYLTSWPIIAGAGLFGMAIPDFNQVFTQLGLFVLALGVAMTGPGALSLDRLMFRRSAPVMPPPANEQQAA